MNNILYWLLVILVSVFAVGGAYAGFVLIMLSGIVVDAFDYTRVQKQVSGAKGVWISLFGVVSLCTSILVLLISSRIAGFLIRFLGMKLGK